MTAEQLALDFWALTPPKPRPVDPHQRGQVRMPFNTVGGRTAGDLVPAWVCCVCGGIEVSDFTLGLNHGCCDKYRAPWVAPTCQRALPDGREPYRPFDAHWIAPTTARKDLP